MSDQHGHYRKKGAGIMGEPLWTRQQYVDMNRAFALAMLEARAKGLEHFSVGVITEPATRRPRTLLPESVFSPTSYAGMCEAAAT
jgi:hypothetical protein